MNGIDPARVIAVPIIRTGRDAAIFRASEPPDRHQPAVKKVMRKGAP